MPTYEYRCLECHEQFEKFQSFRARPLRTHSECGGKLQKIFHARGVVFKGPGFYVTDSRSSKAGAKTNGKGTGAEKSSEKSTETDGSGSSDSGDTGSAKKDSADAKAWSNGSSDKAKNKKAKSGAPVSS